VGGGCRRGGGAGCLYARVLERLWAGGWWWGVRLLVCGAECLDTRDLERLGGDAGAPGGGKRMRGLERRKFALETGLCSSSEEVRVNPFSG